MNRKLISDDTLYLFASQSTGTTFQAGAFVDLLSKRLQLIGLQLADGTPSGTVLQSFPAS